MEEVTIYNEIELNDLEVMVKAVKDYNNKLEVGHAGEFDSLKYLGSGAYGYVKGYKNYAIKVLSDTKGYYDTRDNFIIPKLEDIHILKELQTVSAIPKLYASIGDNAVIMERIDGVTLDELWKNVNYQGDSAEYLFHENFKQLLADSIKEILDCGLQPNDLHSNNLMVCQQTGKPRIIDVGMYLPYKYGEPIDIYVERAIDRRYRQAEKILNMRKYKGAYNKAFEAV